MQKELFKKMDEYIFSLKEQENEDQECDHYIIEVDGFKTCQICGSVLTQIYKTESQDFKFFEDKPKIKSKHDQIKDIKKHLYDYIIKSQTKEITKEQMNKLELYLFKHSESYLIKNFRTSLILSWMKEENIAKIHFYEIYRTLILKKESNSHLLNIVKCNEILDMCKRFIDFHKTTIKNISKKVLVYFIVKHLYNISLDDYIAGTTKNTFERYKKFTNDFFNGVII